MIKPKLVPSVEVYFNRHESEVSIVAKPLNAKQLDGRFDHPAFPNLPLVGRSDAELLGDVNVEFTANIV